MEQLSRIRIRRFGAAVLVGLIAAFAFAGPGVALGTNTSATVVAEGGSDDGFSWG